MIKTAVDRSAKIKEHRTKSTGNRGTRQTFAVHVMLSWEIITALGGPVVPAEGGEGGEGEEGR